MQNRFASLALIALFAVACGRVRFETLSDGSDAGVDGAGQDAAQRDAGNDPGELVDVSLGAYHSCFLYDSGRVYCRGRNDGGQLGLGNFDDPSAGWAVGVNDATRLSTGGYHTTVLSSQQGLLSTGVDYYGQLGNGAPTNTSNTFVAANITQPLVDFYAWQWGSCYRGTQDSFCWGYNDSFQLGTGTRSGTTCTTSSTVSDCELEPTQVLAEIHALASTAHGAWHGCGVGVQEVRCWGFNNAGQLGVDPTTGASAQPVSVAGLPGKAYRAVFLGHSHACALAQDGTAYCWGKNDDGELGNGSQVSTHVPSLLPLANIRLMATAGARIDTEIRSTTCALTQADELFCWGNNRRGQVGVGSATEVFNTPQSLGTFLNADQLVAGGRHLCLKNQGGEVFCWGHNTQGQVDDSGNPFVSTPRRINPLSP